MGLTSLLGLPLAQWRPQPRARTARLPGSLLRRPRVLQTPRGEVRGSPKGTLCSPPSTQLLLYFFTTKNVPPCFLPKPSEIRLSSLKLLRSQRCKKKMQSPVGPCAAGSPGLSLCPAGFSKHFPVLTASHCPEVTVRCH